MHQAAYDNPMRRATLLCPLRLELKLLQRHLRGAPLDIDSCGPGEQGIDRWMRQRGHELPAGSVVVLAGLAGSLCDDLRAGEARIVQRVRAASGEAWTCLLLRSSVAPAVPRTTGAISAPVAQSEIVITSHATIVSSPQDRGALAQRTGASIVDMESVGFARLATQRGWNWGIVRGISDDPFSALPANLENWVLPDGRTRLPAVLASLLRQPRLLGTLRRMQRDAAAALQAAASLIRDLLGQPREIIRGQIRNLTETEQ